MIKAKIRMSIPISLERRSEPIEHPTHIPCVDPATREPLGEVRIDSPEDVDAAVARADNLYQTHLARARALVYLGRHEEAVESLQNAVRLNSRSPEPFAMLADQLARLGRFDEAEQYYRDALSVAPDFFPSYLGLARVYLAQGRRDDATAAVRQAADLAPGHPAVVAMTQQLESGR